jgi:hypothetical protein
MTTLYYLPSPGDFEQTSVCDGRFQFVAFQPTAMPDTPPWDVITDKLKTNPSFGLALDEERQRAWQEWRQNEQVHRSEQDMHRVMRKK